MAESCPFLGTHWDSTVPYIEPDPDNRCYARAKKVRIMGVFTKRKPGVRIRLTEQVQNCYRDFCQCEAHRRKIGD